MKPWKVLFVEVNEDGSVGGSHQVLYDMVLRLDRTRVDPVVLFYQKNRFVQAFEDAGVPVEVWEDIRLREHEVHHSGKRLRKVAEVGKAIRRRYRFLKAGGFDLVHMNNSPRTGRDDWLPAARMARISIVASARGDAQPLPGRGLRPSIHRLLMRRFDCVVAVSEYIAESMRAQGIPGRRVRVIHDGVNPDALALLGRRSRDEVRNQLGVPDDRVFVSVIGNIRSWKGQHVVIEALAQMDPEERSGLFVVFVGAVRDVDEEYFAGLKQMVEDQNLTSVVSFAGSRNDVPEILWSADIAVHSSTTPEPGGTVVIEAMTFGAPVIAASRGGHLDYFEDGTGLVHDVERPAELAGHLSMLLNNPAVREEMGRRAKTRAMEFSIERTASRMSDLYDEILGRPQLEIGS